MPDTTPGAAPAWRRNGFASFRRQKRGVARGGGLSAGAPRAPPPPPPPPPAPPAPLRYSADNGAKNGANNGAKYVEKLVSDGAHRASGGGGCRKSSRRRRRRPADGGRRINFTVTSKTTHEKHKRRSRQQHRRLQQMSRDELSKALARHRLVRPTTTAPEGVLREIARGVFLDD